MLFRDLIGSDLLALFTERCKPQRTRIFTPEKTLLAFLTQSAGRETSCKKAVIEVLTHQIHKGHQSCSLNTSSYVRARTKLPTTAMKQLNHDICEETFSLVPQVIGDGQPRIFYLDGTTFAVKDTKENLKKFPISHGKYEDFGSPIARSVILTCAITGQVIASEIGGFKGKGTGEISLGSNLVANLKNAQILVADAMFSSFYFICRVKRQQADYVGRLRTNQKRRFTILEIPTPQDKIVIFKKPRLRNHHNTNQDFYNSVPDDLILRLVEITDSNGKSIKILTTLLDYTKYSASCLLEIYQRRWDIELDLRSIKTVSGRDYFECKTPDMVEKEWFAQIMVYNLVKRLVTMAAKRFKLKTTDISFKQAFTIYKSLRFDVGKKSTLLFSALKQAIIRKRVGRCEPRMRKRLPKINDYPKLRIHRQKWHAFFMLYEQVDLKVCDRMIEFLKNLGIPLTPEHNKRWRDKEKALAQSGA